MTGRKRKKLRWKKYGAILLRGQHLGGRVLVLVRVALADGTEDIWHITVSDKLLCAEDVQLSVLDYARNLGCVIQTFGAFGHSEFGLNHIEKFLDVGDGMTRVVKVNDLLRFHCPGSFGRGHIDDCGVLVGHLLTREQVDERVREPDLSIILSPKLIFALGNVIIFCSLNNYF